MGCHACAFVVAEIVIRCRHGGDGAQKKQMNCFCVLVRHVGAVWGSESENRSPHDLHVGGEMGMGRVELQGAGEWVESENESNRLGGKISVEE